MPELAAVPILVHTAVPPSSDVRDKHWNACLRKPAGADLFLITVAQLCKQRD